MVIEGQSHLEEIVSHIRPEDQKAFDEHIQYRSTENTARMRYENFADVEGGTDRLLDDVYHDSYKKSVKGDWKEKGDDEAWAETLEAVVVGMLKQIGPHRHNESFLLKNFLAMKDGGSFETDGERAAALATIVQNMGARQEDLQKLQQAVRSGDKMAWNAGVRAFTDTMKGSLITNYVNQHGLKATQDREHLFKAYYIKRIMQPELGMSPVDIPLALSPQVPYVNLMQNAEQIPADRNPSELKLAQLELYKPHERQAAKKQIDFSALDRAA